MTDELSEAVEPLPEEKDIRSTISERIEDGTIPIAAGGLTLFVAARSVGRGRARSIPLAAVGTALIGIGARKRQSIRESDEYEPWTIADEETAEGPKETSDDAHAARQRAGHGREDDVDGGDTLESAPDREDGGDPRLEDDDEVDLSESARADEPGEATGPEPEQAEPAQTEATEPEPEPDAEPTAGDEGTGEDEDDET